MSFKKYNSLKALLRHADRIIDDFDAVSIDLFDTIFIRRVHDPDMLKPAVARYIAAKARRKGTQRRWTWEEVQASRDAHETAQRAETGKAFDDHEARYPDYMRKVLGDIFQAAECDELLEEVTAYELGLESAMIVPRADLVRWIEKVHARGKVVVIASDIYLPSAHLKQLVKNAGLLDHVTDVVSSADTFLAKASGRAFPLMAERYGLSGDRWLHIGDNPISDGLRPAEFGLTALILQDAAEKRRHTVAQMYTKFAGYRPFWKGRLLQQLMLPLESENQPRSSLYVQGYSFLGFLLGFFIQTIMEQCHQHDLKRVFFFSREGWTYKKVWDAAIPYMYPREDVPQSHYLYVSRLALGGASCAHDGLPLEKANIAFLPPGNRDIRDVCRVFSLKIEPMGPLLQRHGIRADEPLSPAYSATGYQKFADLVEDPVFQSQVKAQTRPFNDALQIYLEESGFFESGDVALVDVGWLGTIQRFLYDAVKHRDDRPNFHGFLLAASRGNTYPTTDGNYIKGVLYDHEHFDFAGSTILYAREFFEEACRAPHPTLVGYEPAENGYRLQFKDRQSASVQNEMLQNRYFEDLQKGIFDAAARYGAAVSVLGLKTEEIKPWLNYLLVSKLAFPSTKEIKRLKHRYHIDDLGGKHKPPGHQPARHLWEYPSWALRWIPWLRLQFYLKKQRPI
jgi:predicted HAD superfamily hydrolase